MIILEQLRKSPRIIKQTTDKSSNECDPSLLGSGNVLDPTKLFDWFCPRPSALFMGPLYKPNVEIRQKMLALRSVTYVTPDNGKKREQLF